MSHLPEGEELRLEFLISEPVPNLGVALFDFLHESVHHAVDSHFALVQRLDEVVPDL